VQTRGTSIKSRDEYDALSGGLNSGASLTVADVPISQGAQKMVKRNAHAAQIEINFCILLIGVVRSCI